MKFTLSWLKDHLDTDAPAEAIADKLTAIGLEVEELTNPAAALAPFKVARVLAADKHPQADKLQVLTVDAGDGPVQVGFLAQAPLGDACVATFDEVGFSPDPPADLRDGS